jgi:hypothetical protein
MTEEQLALYGGSVWIGPLFLAGAVLLYWWLNNGPLTERGKRRAAERRARSAAEWQRVRERSTRERPAPAAGGHPLAPPATLRTIVGSRVRVPGRGP